MDAQTLQDRISKGLGVAARKCGTPYTVYRPDGALQPIDPRHRVIELPAFFAPGAAGIGQAASYGQALWQGIFDTSYTHSGDYLVGERDTYFIALQTPGSPVQCVQVNRVVTVVRPTAAMQGGYSGFFATPGDPVINTWPASLLEAGGHGGSRIGETRFGEWRLLLPRLPMLPQTADVVSDDLENTYTVGSAEETAFGWRMLLRQVGA